MDNEISFDQYQYTGLERQRPVGMLVRSAAIMDSGDSWVRGIYTDVDSTANTVPGMLLHT